MGGGRKVTSGVTELSRARVHMTGIIIIPSVTIVANNYLPIGFNPMNNGESVIINVPILTEERRKELAKHAKAEGENAKVSIRNDRKDANNELKKLDISEDLLKNTEQDVQDLTDKYIKNIDALYVIKEKEIMTV